MKFGLEKNVFIVGIDEAGRGPLAGPLCVAAVAATLSTKHEVRNPKQIQKFKFQNSKMLKNIKDSKKLNAKQREEWEKIIKKNFESHFVFVSHKIIDKIGMGKALKLGVRKVLEKFSQKPDLVLMDGSLFAPEKYNQETIIKGDEKVPLISAGSIIAKVSRDRVMMNMRKKYPEYCFNEHKGYGTKKHFEKIIKHGFCEIHRKTFCKNVVNLAKKR